MSSQALKLSWKFPRVFWVANSMELFERAAYYGCFIALSLYLTNRVGFTDIETGWVIAVFASFMYFLPTFMGLLSDRIGFRNALILAFSLLTVGYASLGAFQSKAMALVSLGTILFGGSIVKPCISGTVAKSSDDLHRARAFSLFYQMVNIGSFSGKTIAKPLRVHLGLEYINYYAALMALIALVITLFCYKAEIVSGTQKTVKEVFQGLAKVIKNIRFISLIIIVGGFWAIQGQLYATLPKYALRLIGEGASPEWLANVNPLVVVLCVVPITHLMRRFKPISSIGVALAMTPFTAFIISLSPQLTKVTGTTIHLFGNVTMHPITLLMIVGIALMGLTECFLSPRFLEFASKQAPKGEEGLYLGYSHLTSFFSWMFGFAISGYLLNAYCPDPKKIAPENMVTAYEHAHYIWYAYAAIGLTAFLCLIVYRIVTNYVDRKQAKVALESQLKCVG